MKKILSVLAGLFMICITAYADYNGSVITGTSELNFSTKSGYDVLLFENGATLEEPGAPMLPVKYIKLVIPFDKKVKNIIINSTSVQQLGGTYNIYPYQTPIPTDGSVPEVFTEPNPAIYNSSTPYPNSLVEIIEDGYPMNYHVIILRFNLVEYIPVDQIVNVYTNIDFTIEYENTTENIIQPLRISQQRHDRVRDYIQPTLHNSADFNTVMGGALEVIALSTSTKNLDLKFMPSLDIDMPEYIIITNELLKEEFRPLADWKTQKGVPTLIVTTEEIEQNYLGVDMGEKIRNYLKDVNYNWGAGIYILLGGDVNVIPARIGCYSTVDGWRETDLYYSTVVGNWNADGDMQFGEGSDVVSSSPVFFLGRAPVENATEVGVITNKILGYEKLTLIDPSINTSYIENMLFLSAINQDNLDYYIVDNISDYINNIRLYDNASSYGAAPPFYELDRETTIDYMSNGYPAYGFFHLVYHMDHSGPTAMGTSSLMKNQRLLIPNVANLQNGPHYQILFSGGCEPNHFLVESISEAYVLNPNGGGVAFIGCTAEGWGYYGYQYKQFCQQLFDVPANSQTSVRYNLGWAFQKATDGTISNVYARKDLNLLGDPEMMVWTAEPTTLNVVSIPGIVTNLNNNVQVIVSNIITNVDVTVCLLKEDEIYSHQTISCTPGSQQFDFTVNPETAGLLTVTVTAHNYLPVIIDDIEVQIDGDHLHVSDYVVDDDQTGSSYGNGDIQADAGESIELPITISNSGTTDIAGVNATLSCSSPEISVITSSAVNYGDIAITADATQTFQFDIDYAAGDETMVSFDLNISGNSGAYTKTSSFDIQIGSPDLLKVTNYYSIVADNGNNLIDPGESVELNIEVFNDGHAEATGVGGYMTAVLTSADGNISVTNANSQYPNVIAGETEQNSTYFAFTTNSTQYVNEVLTLQITNEYGLSWTYDFDLSECAFSVAPLAYTPNATTLKLSWQAVNDASVAGYNVYRSLTAQGTYIKVNNYLIQGGSFIIDDNNGAGLNPVTEYYYRVCPVTIDGNECMMTPAFGTDGFFTETVIAPHLGWPVSPTPAAQLGYEMTGSPIVCDIDNDGLQEIFFTCGSASNDEGGIYGFKPDGTQWFFTDPNTTNKSGFYDLEVDIRSTPAIGDIDGDGEFEILSTTCLSTADPQPDNARKLIALTTRVDAGNDGLPDMVWATNPGLEGRAFAGPVLSDINNDGNLESVVSLHYGNTVTQTGGPAVFDHTGNYLANWPITYTDDLAGLGAPAVGDLNGDGFKEIVLGTMHGIYIWNHDGTDYTGSNPVYSNADYRMDAPPVIVNIDNTGNYEIAFLCVNGYDAYINVIDDQGGFTLPGWSENDASHLISLSFNVIMTSSWNGYIPRLSVGDLDIDGDVEVVIGDDGILHVFDNGGIPFNNFPVTVAGLNGQFKTPLLADVDNDNTDIEIVMASKDGSIHAFKINTTGEEAPGWPITLPYTLNGNICISDVDNDGMNEVIATTPGEFFMWDTPGDGSKIEWGHDRHDCYNTGCYSGFDLFMKDRYDDFGAEPVSTWQVFESPDIWVRNQNDGFVDQTLQNPKYNASNPNFVYVNVRNRGSVPSEAQEANLHLYWTLGREETWPHHWYTDGDNNQTPVNDDPMGGEITTIGVEIPSLSPGESVILEKEWSVPDPATFDVLDPTSYSCVGIYPMMCLLARIESIIDPMTNEQPGTIKPNVQNNNNIITHNTYITTTAKSPDNFVPVVSVLVNNTQETAEFFDLNFDYLHNPSEGQFIDPGLGGIYLHLGQDLYENWVANGSQGRGFVQNEKDFSLEIASLPVFNTEY